MEKDQHDLIFQKNFESFKNHVNVPEMDLFSLWSDFDGKPASGIFRKYNIMVEQPFFESPAKNHMSGKILVDFWEFFSCDA